MSRNWYLDFELLQHFGEQNRIIHGWVIDDLVRFTVQWAQLTDDSQGCVHPTSPNLARTHIYIGWSSHCTFVSEFGYLAVFSNAGGSRLNLSDVENAKFCTFWPIVKLGKGWARSLDQLLKLYDQTSRIHLMVNGHPLRGCWVWCSDKIKKGKKVHGWNF